MDATSLSVQLLTEVVDTLIRSTGLPKAREVLSHPGFRALLQDNLADQLEVYLPGTGLSKRIARRVMDTLIANPDVFNDQSRITAQLFVREEDDKLIAYATVSQPPKAILSEKWKFALGAYALGMLTNVSSDAAYDAIKDGAQKAFAGQQQIVLIVTGDVVNLRIDPKLGSAVLTHLDSGTQVTKIGEEGDWVFVLLLDPQNPENNKAGWVHKEYLQPRP
jgi:hypothetical protein